MAVVWKALEEMPAECEGYEMMMTRGADVDELEDCLSHLWRWRREPWPEPAEDRHEDRQDEKKTDKKFGTMIWTRGKRTSSRMSP
mmetsp:Transcript_19161/g.66607  ORF Transcript_19161/g.66607 Transcript_19161/m.66607 type:complete len:85 (+) Transcript_19161:260-514(+)